MVGSKEMYMVYSEAVFILIQIFQNAFLLLSTFGQESGGGGRPNPIIRIALVYGDLLMLVI